MTEYERGLREAAKICMDSADRVALVYGDRSCPEVTMAERLSDILNAMANGYAMGRRMGENIDQIAFDIISGNQCMVCGDQNGHGDLPCPKSVFVSVSSS